MQTVALTQMRFFITLIVGISMLQVRVILQRVLRIDAIGNIILTEGFTGVIAPLGVRRTLLEERDPLRILLVCLEHLRRDTIFRGVRHPIIIDVVTIRPWRTIWYMILQGLRLHRIIETADAAMAQRSAATHAAQALPLATRPLPATLKESRKRRTRQYRQRRTLHYRRMPI